MKGRGLGGVEVGTKIQIRPNLNLRPEVAGNSGKCSSRGFLATVLVRFQVPIWVKGRNGEPNLPCKTLNSIWLCVETQIGANVGAVWAEESAIEPLLFIFLP